VKEREPATRHLRADELREQLELLGEERKTTLYRRRAGAAHEPAISGPSERTVTMLDASIEALAGQPSLGIGTAREPEAGTANQPARMTGDASQRSSRRLSDTYRLPRLGKKGPLLGAAAALLSLAILAAAIAWSASPRVSAERVVAARVLPPPAAPPPSAPPVSTRLPALARQVVPPSAPPSAPASTPAAVPERPRQPATSARTTTSARAGASARHAVELLLAGRTRDALDAYRALVAEPGSAAEFAVVASLLEQELDRCGSDKESERCAR
jgi:hypothetical protein